MDLRRIWSPILNGYSEGIQLGFWFRDPKEVAGWGQFTFAQREQPDARRQSLTGEIRLWSGQKSCKSSRRCAGERPAASLFQILQVFRREIPSGTRRNWP